MELLTSAPLDLEQIRNYIAEPGTANPAKMEAFCRALIAEVERLRVPDKPASSTVEKLKQLSSDCAERGMPGTAELLDGIIAELEVK